MTVNVDFAPTFVELAGATIPASIDGRSLVPILGGSPPPVDSWRQMVLLQHGDDVDGDEPLLRNVDPGTLEPPDSDAPVAGAEPAFEGVRTSRYTYVEYTTGEKALYDHMTDPDQLKNLMPTPDGTLAAKLAALVHAMHDCQGQACRDAEQAATP
jgi:N-acetylglucosamine-6-sulfatase